MSDNRDCLISFEQLSRSENLHTELRHGLKLIELSLLGIQDPTRGPHVDPDDLVPIVGHVMELQEKFEQYSDAIGKLCSKQPAQILQADRTRAGKKGGSSGQQ